MSKKKRKIKKVALKEHEVLEVSVPKGQMPVVLPDIEQDKVVVAPTHKQTWMEFLFGTSKEK